MQRQRNPQSERNREIAREEGPGGRERFKLNAVETKNDRVMTASGPSPVAPGIFQHAGTGRKRETV